MTENVKSYVKSALSAAGFSVMEDYGGEISAIGSGYPAFYRIKDISLSELKLTDGTSCRADVTVCVRMLGSKAGFYDIGALSAMAERTIEEMYFGSQMIVKKISCGEIRKNMQLGRLEYPLEAVFVTELERSVKSR